MRNVVSCVLHLSIRMSVVWGTRTPKRFHPPTIFKTASSSSRIHDRLSDYKTSLYRSRCGQLTLPQTSRTLYSGLVALTCSCISPGSTIKFFYFQAATLKSLLEKKNADNEIRTRKVCHRRILSPIRIPVPTYPHVRFCKIYSSV